MYLSVFVRKTSFDSRPFAETKADAQKRRCICAIARIAAHVTITSLIRNRKQQFTVFSIFPLHSNTCQCIHLRTCVRQKIHFIYFQVVVCTKVSIIFCYRFASLDDYFSLMGRKKKRAQLDPVIHIRLR